MIRLAIYFTPATDSPLAREAALWLGRDIFSPEPKRRKAANALSLEQMAELTAAPCHYGFHGTIKPPFRIGTQVDIDQVKKRLQLFAARQRSFILPPLQISYMDHFFCLKPAAACSELHDLAGAAVQSFDDLRLAATEAELDRRRSGGLTQAQEEMLLTWGYPYIMDEFRFHLTLTGKITDQGLRKKIFAELTRRFLPQYMASVPFSHLSLFIEIDRTPMKIIADYPLASQVQEVLK